VVELVRVPAETALTRSGTAAATHELARNSEDPEIREKAIFWLGQSGDERAADYLEELVGEDW
jgi:hypothetical protein